MVLVHWEPVQLCGDVAAREGRRNGTEVVGFLRVIGCRARFPFDLVTGNQRIGYGRPAPVCVPAVEPALKQLAAPLLSGRGKKYSLWAQTNCLDRLLSTPAQAANPA